MDKKFGIILGLLFFIAIASIVSARIFYIPGDQDYSHLYGVWNATGLSVHGNAVFYTGTGFVNITGTSGDLETSGNITALYSNAISNWSHYNYPSACPAGNAITQLGDAVVCSDSWVDVAGDTMTGNLVINANLTVGTNVLYVNNDTGQVGIGTATPESLLHLVDAGSIQLILNADTDNSNESDAASILFRRDGSTNALQIGVVGDDGEIFSGSLANMPYFYSPSSNKNILFATDNGLAMEITSGRDVNIYDVLNVSNEIRVATNGSASDPGYTWTDDVDMGIFRAGTNELGFSTAGSEAMRINNLGRIGIGTSTIPLDGLPTDFDSSGILLEIGDGTVDSGITFRSRTSGSNAFDIWQDYGVIDLYIDARRDDDNSDIYFRTKTSDTPINALTIKGSGNVGIGVTDPDSALEVTGNVHISSLEGSYTNGEAALCVWNNGTIFARDGGCN